MSNENGIREFARLYGSDGLVYLFASPGGDRFVECDELPKDENGWSEVEDGVTNGAFDYYRKRHAYPITATKSYLVRMAHDRGEQIDFERIKVAL